MPVRVKICGLSTPDTIGAAARHGATEIGFVFYPPSPRHLGFERAAALAALVPEAVAKVGVFVDPDDALVEAAAVAARLDALQLHKVSPARAAALRARFALPVWAAVAVRTSDDIAGASGFAGAADRLLYDAKTPDDALPGGMGVRFDWALLAGVRHPLPWLLSGGLTPDTLAAAVQITGARHVDVSSGVESAPGVKDVDKIAAFLKAAGEL